MKLKQLTGRIWYFPMEEERDRPNLGYIRGEKYSVAVDAGHSEAHVKEFYQALQEAGLPLPGLTVLTHWHWDHTFGLHAASGLSLANSLTNKALREFREGLEKNGPDAFLKLDVSIRREYEGDRPVIVVPADMEYSGEMWLDAGDCRIHVFQAPSPHTDDTTLIEVPEEKVLFLGDSAGGTFPTWEKNLKLCALLAKTIEETDVDWCLEGHEEPCSKQEMLEDLRGDSYED